jgi:hypothetical protein
MKRIAVALASAPAAPSVLAALSALSTLLCACEAVPTLTFEPPDGAPEAAGGAADGGSPTQTDAGVEGGCPSPASTQTPFVCCGAITCEGLCAGQCDSCVNRCTVPGEFCCAKTNNVMCLPAGSICH